MRRVGDQIACRVEQRAAEIQSFLDVHRIGCVLQLQTHLLGDVHEQVVEHLQQHRIGLRTCRVGHHTRHPALQQQVIQLGQSRFPTGFHDRRCVLLRDDGWTGNRIARAQVFANHQRAVEPLTTAKHAHRFTARHFAQFMNSVARLGRRVAIHHRLHRNRFHHQALALHQKGEPLTVSGLKARPNRSLRSFDLQRRSERSWRTVKRPGHHQRRITALITHMHTVQHPDLAHAHLLALQLFARRHGERVQLRGNLGQ